MRSFESLYPLGILLVVWPVVAGAAKSSDELELLAPRDGETVPLLHPIQKAWMTMPRTERIAKVADVDGFRRRMEREGTHPLPVLLKWRCRHPDGDACQGIYAVEVMKRRDGRCHFRAENLATNAVEIWNLEVGEEYTWCVWCGEKENGARFTTEDMAPRCLKWEGVPNVRDQGGWKTKDGYRVKQGLVYRSAGLNDNALTCLTADETLALHRAGQLAVLFGAKGREIAELIDAGEMEPNDARLRKTFARERFEKGRMRGTPESREFVRTFFGIRSDVDLRRRDSECWGMTGSPLGPETAWLSRPSTCYEGLGTDEGKRQLRDALGVFLDPVNYGIVYHCIGGADRTGSLAFVIGALLGVDEDDLWRDWELTCFGGQRPAFVHAKCLERLLEVFGVYPGDSINERVKNYVRALGFGDADLERIRMLLLDRGGRPTDLRGLPRWHTPEGVGNMRDLGGWPGLAGRRVRTGRVFRFARFEDISRKGREYVVGTLGIRTDLDLRTSEQVRELEGRSPLGVKYVNRSSTAYAGFDSPEGRKFFSETFRWFLNDAEYPVAMHCIKGADRTGSWAFLLNGLLGVSEPDLRMDWELTHNFNPNPLFKHRMRYDKLLEMIRKRAGATFTDKVVAYAKDCGISDEEIARWREMMLEESE